ncbi:MAG: helix-turn-helix transcriptional regulator [Lysobacterales bacterium]
MLVDASKIKAMRLDHGWTQDQLAQLCGVSVRTIQRIEKSGVASLDTTNALAAVFSTERKTILVQGGVREAQTEVPLKYAVLVAVLTLLVGFGLGAVV